jgi:tetratricopeptide (TPR) repeat protein
MTIPVPERAAPAGVRLMIFVGVAAILAATFAAYSPAITSGFIWDDPDYVINNITIRDVEGLVRMWTDLHSLPQWYPLVHTTFWVEYQLWQLAPMGYHIDNIALHAISALLLWRLLRRLEVPGAFLAAAIFALHPVNVESVAWITERKNVLSGALIFASMLAYLRFAEHPSERRFYVVSFLLFVAAILSKSVVATMPPVMMVILWWKRGTLKPRDVWPLLPMFLIGAAMGLFTAYLEATQVGADGTRIAELNFSVFDRFLIAGRAVWFYATKLLVPWPIIFIYPKWKLDASIWWQWLFPIGVAGVLAALIMLRGRIGRAPAAAAMIFCGALFPALGFLNVYPMRFSFVADHFQYHACAAMIAGVAAILWRRAGRISFILLIPLFVMTFNRAHVYEDAETLWRDTIAQNPNSWMVPTNLANSLINIGQDNNDPRRVAEAIQLYARALELDPTIHETHLNYASALALQGKYQESLDEFDVTLQLHPDFAPAYFGIAQVLQKQGQIELAIEKYEWAIQLYPRYSMAHYRLAVLLQQTGALERSLNHYREAVSGLPGNARVRTDLGGALLAARQFDEAIHNLREAIQIDPTLADAWLRLGAAQRALGRNAEAEHSFKTALQLNPDLARRLQGG